MLISHSQGKALVTSMAHFWSVNTPPMADFELPVQSWEEVLTTGTLEPALTYPWPAR